MITDEILVSEIKKRLNITGNYHDALLLAYANDTKEFLHSAGIPPVAIDSESAVGLISRGVADLWNMGAGQGHFSSVFFQRATQMSLTDWNVNDTEGAPITLNVITTNEIDECVKCLDEPSGSAGEQLVFVAASEDDLSKCTECLND